MDRISVIVNVIDQEVLLLPRLLSSIKGLNPEIILIDMTSGSDLFDLANKYHAKVYKHDLVPYVELIRNYGISKAQGDWILIMDPDEELSQNLSDKINYLIAKKEADYYRLPRKNIIFGKWMKHSRWWPDYNIRFFKKGFVSWNEVIHSVPLTRGEGMDLEAVSDNAIIHYHYQTIDQYVERLNRYTNAQARNLVKEGYKFNWQDLIIKPTGEFISRFFKGEGFKDGLHGFALSGLQAFSEFIVFLKVWQNKDFEQKELDLSQVIRQMVSAEKEIHYWQADTLLKNKGGLIQIFKRKFKLSQ